MGPGSGYCAGPLTCPRHGTTVLNDRQGWSSSTSAGGLPFAFVGRKLNLVGAAEIANMLGVSRQRVNQIVREKGFPDPVAELTAGRIWLLEDVQAWARKAGRL